MLSDNWFTPTNISGIFEKSWHFFRAFFYFIIRLTLMIIVPMQLIVLAAGFLTKVEGIAALIGWTIIIVASAGGQLWLTAALILQSLDICFGRDYQTTSQILKKATQYITPLLLVFLSILVFSFAFAMIGVLILQIFAGSSPSPFIRSMQVFLFLTAFFIIYPRLFLAPFFLIHDHLKIPEALRRSYELTGINRPKVVLIFLGYFLLNMLTLGINFLVPLIGFALTLLVIPFSMIIQFFLYIDLRAERKDLVIPPEIHTGE